MLADNSTVRLDLDNEPQPDVQLFIDPTRGGQAAIDADDYVAGAPEPSPVRNAGIGTNP